MSTLAVPPQTLAQKLIARAAGRTQVGASIWDPGKVVLVLDHYVPAQDPAAQQIVQFARDTARQWKLPHVIDSEGICHVVLPERGHLRPGMFCVGGDSHSPTGGAFGCYMFGIGATEMLGVCVTGQIWVQVPRTPASTRRWNTPAARCRRCPWPSA